MNDSYRILNEVLKKIKDWDLMCENWDEQIVLLRKSSINEDEYRTKSIYIKLISYIKENLEKALKKYPEDVEGCDEYIDKCDEMIKEVITSETKDWDISILPFFESNGITGKIFDVSFGRSGNGEMTITLKELICIMYYFHYENVSFTYGVFSVGSNFLDSKMPKTLSKIEKNKPLNYGFIKKLVEKIYDDEISSEEKYNIYPEYGILALDYHHESMDLKQYMVLQVIIDMCELLTAPLIKSSKNNKEKTEYMMVKEFCQEFLESSGEKNYYRDQHRKYKNVKKWLDENYRDENIFLISNVSLISKEFLLSAMKYNKLLRSIKSSGFKNSMLELLETVLKTESGLALYGWELVLGFCGVSLLEDAKDVDLWTENRSMPILRIYMATFIKQFKKLHSWYGEEKWYKSFMEVNYTIETFYRKLLNKSINVLLFHYEAKKISKMFYNNCELLEKDVNEIFSNFKNIDVQGNKKIFQLIVEYLVVEQSLFDNSLEDYFDEAIIEVGNRLLDFKNKRDSEAE